MFGRKRKELEREKRMVTAQSSHKIVRKVPEIIALSYTATGNRKYQQDAVYVSGSRKIAGNRKTRVFAAVCDGMGEWQMAVAQVVQRFTCLERGLKK